MCGRASEAEQGRCRLISRLINDPAVGDGWIWEGKVAVGVHRGTLSSGGKAKGRRW